LLEETGHEAPEWISFGKYSVDANRGAGNAHLFLAMGAEPVAEPDMDDLEEMQLLHLDVSELEKALWDEAFKVVPWTAMIAMALLHLQQ
jgi:ADP-ribose pyrophosphatase